MRNIYVFWVELNWLEFVTYVLVPTSMTLVILIYLYFNISLLKLSFDFDINLLKKIDNNLEKKHSTLNRLLDKYCFKHCSTDNESDKEKG